MRRFFKISACSMLMIALSACRAHLDKTAVTSETAPPSEAKMTESTELIRPEEKKIIEAAEKQAAALKAHDRLMAAKGFKEGTPPTYPDDFAGSFIGTDDKYHVFYVKQADADADRKVAEKYRAYFDESDPFILKPAAYSYNYLNKLVDQFIQTTAEDIISGEVDVERNQALLTVPKDSDLLQLTDEEILYPAQQNINFVELGGLAKTDSVRSDVCCDFLTGPLGQQNRSKH